jgi:hypothetical protein
LPLQENDWKISADRIVEPPPRCKPCDGLGRAFRNTSCVRGRWRIRALPPAKKLFFKLRKAKSKISALTEGDLRPDQVKLIAKQLAVTRVYSKVFSRIRRATEQGITSAEQGILAQEQGILPANRISPPDEIFGTYPG